MTKTQIRDAIRDAYTLLDRIADLSSYIGPERAQDHFRNACEASGQLERDHRGFTRSFSRGQASYRVGAELCAEMLVCQYVGRFLTGNRKRPASWIDAAQTRRDVVLCYALGEAIKAALRTTTEDRQRATGRNSAEDQKELRKLVKRFKAHPIHQIDYAQDVAA